MLPRKPNPDLWPIFTISGLVAFMVLYLMAASYYPGGSDFNIKQRGFSWLSNYWCELLGRNAKNGQANISRPFGMAGMLLLVMAVATFWYNLPKLIPTKKVYDHTLRYSGVISMISSLFIFSFWHDIVVYIAVFFGSIAIILSMYGFFVNRFFRFFFMCALCLVLVLINNFIYMSKFMIDYLPVIQKITFLFVFVWIGMISLHYLNRQDRT